LAHIYLDEGVDVAFFRKIVKMIKASGLSVYTVDRHFFLQKQWEKKVDLIIIPGGRDLPYHENLKGEACRRLRAFVFAGGVYLGICAGGYFGSSSVTFEEGGKLEVLGKRELAFFPGTAIGPAYGKNIFRYDSQAGARLARVQWQEKVFPVYYNGGCYFECHPEVEVLASYEDIKDNPSAIIECSVGQGKAFLSGVHIEENKELWDAVLNRILTNMR
jgi:biotin--protein ligase